MSGASLPDTGWRIIRDAHWRFGGYMILRRSNGERFGSPGARGHSHQLAVWRNPVFTRATSPKSPPAVASDVAGSDDGGGV